MNGPPVGVPGSSINNVQPLVRQRFGATRLALRVPIIWQMMTSIPFAVLLLASAIGCMASPGGVRPSAGPATSKHPAQSQVTPSADVGAGNQVSPDPNLPVMLPPQLGAPPRESGDDPEFPRELRHTGLTYVVRAKVCVSRTGTVDSMSILKGSDPALVQNLISAVKGWRFRPLMANNVVVPFCFFANFEFKSD